MKRQLTIVIKATKLCNLRCNYCYEYEHLADKRHISLTSLPGIFRKLKEIEERQNSEVRICWHGGEPTLLGAQYFEKATEIYNEVFGKRHANIVQTNLFKLTEETLRIFSAVGLVSISFDVLGDDRITANGVVSNSRVIKNMDALRAEGIGFGVINVLTKKNIDKLDKIQEFFALSRLPGRVLPFYRQSSSSQTAEFGLTAEEVAGAYARLVDLHVMKSGDDRLRPIEEFVHVAVNFTTGSLAKSKYNKEEQERVLIIDTNGDLYGDGTTYDRKYCYGNIIHDSVDKLLGSAGRSRAVARANALMSRACGKCPYWGYCSGIAVGEMSDVEIECSHGDAACPTWRAGINRAVDWLSTLSIDVKRHVHPTGAAADLGDRYG